jgi:transposase
MQYRKIHAEFYCGVDVHPKKSYLCILDKSGEKRLGLNLKNNFDNFKETVNPFLPNLAVGCESTYAYYWLADGCHKAGIQFYLCHAMYMKAISGNKQKHDPLDAKTIANLLRTSFFPEAFPYPREMRATRDILRRRHRLVRLRAEAFSHIQMVAHQYCIEDITPKAVKDRKNRRDLIEQFNEQDLRDIVASDFDVIESLDPVIEELEIKIKASALHHDSSSFSLLKTTPGIGDMLALIILYETHDIKRFPTPQRYSSYARVVKCDRTSAGKSVGSKNQKIGNPYLKWAFNSIIISAQQTSERIGKYYRRLESKYGRPRARARIAHQFAVSVYAMLKKQEPFSEERFFAGH